MNNDIVISVIEKIFQNPEQTFILSTLTEDGYPDSRMMGNICDKSIREVYFTCQTGSRKIDEIIKNPKSSIYFTSDTITAWLYGTASVTRNEAVRKKIWNNRILSIYNEGVNSPRLTVIRFIPEKVRFREKNNDYIEFDL